MERAISICTTPVIAKYWATHRLTHAVVFLFNISNAIDACPLFDNSFNTMEMFT